MTTTARPVKTTNRLLNPTTLIVTSGLPGSGKSTRALAWLAEDPARRARVNRDVLREHTFGVMPVLDRQGEQDLTALQRDMVRTLLDVGRSVIVDDTNLTEARIEGWLDIYREFGGRWEWWDFRDVPVDVCVTRDAARGRAGGRHVGEDVIRDMAARHGLPRRADWQRRLEERIAATCGAERARP